MNRPYIICHMVTSLDGKVTGKFLYEPQCEKATEAYYQINRDYKADGFACGRVTMEGSFTGGWYPDLSEFAPCYSPMDYLPDDIGDFFAVAFDPHGRLGWKSSRIIDDDPGYGGAQIIEVLTHQVSRQYLTYLQSMDIPYIFAGDTEIDIEEALSKLKAYFGINKLLLEGGQYPERYLPAGRCHRRSEPCGSPHRRRCGGQAAVHGCPAGTLHAGRCPIPQRYPLAEL